jgi:hypothetical protein
MIQEIVYTSFLVSMCLPKKEVYGEKSQAAYWIFDKII